MPSTGSKTSNDQSRALARPSDESVLTMGNDDRNIAHRSSQLGWAQAQTAGPSLLVGLGLILSEVD